MTQFEKQSDWFSAIVNKSKMTSEAVKDVLERYNIRQSPTIGNPRRLCIQRVYFSGEKHGKHNDSFEFEFKDLKPGVWGLITEGNLKGKTSVLEIIKWLLRGKTSDRLQEGVRSWISNTVLDFQIDKTDYSVRLQQSIDNISGNLIRKVDQKKEIEVAHFNSEEEFEICMSSFMMKELTLDVISAWHKSDSPNEIGTSVIHDWPALSGVLFIGTDYQALFGEVIVDGLNNRLMRMYLGLPWVPTLSTLQTIEKKLTSQQENNEHKNMSERTKRQERYKEIESQLEDKRRELEQMPSNEALQLTLYQVNNERRHEIRQLGKIENQLNTAEQELTEADILYKQDRRDKQNFLEARAANTVFKRLNPTCCPHCETPITEERRTRENLEHTCSICGEFLLESEDAEVILNELDNRVIASAKALEETQKQFNNLEKQKIEIENKISILNQKYEDLQNQMDDFMDRHDLEKKIIGLEALYKEYEEKVEPNDKKDDLDVELKIIRAALKETENRVTFRQSDLLAEVSKKIVEFASSFGMESITSAILTGTPNLQLEKDGIKTSYSKCTDGEKLRLKVAAIIAMLSVAEEKGLGRHPGILLIDSLKAEELVEHDVDKLIEGLVGLAKNLPHLQIIIAATSSESILRHIDEQHRKFAKGDDFLW